MTGQCPLHRCRANMDTVHCPLCRMEMDLLSIYIWLLSDLIHLMDGDGDGHLFLADRIKLNVGGPPPLTCVHVHWHLPLHREQRMVLSGQPERLTGGLNRFVSVEGAKWLPMYYSDSHIRHNSQFKFGNTGKSYGITIHKCSSVYVFLAHIHQYVSL